MLLIVRHMVEFIIKFDMKCLHGTFSLNTQLRANKTSCGKVGCHFFSLYLLKTVRGTPCVSLYEKHLFSAKNSHVYKHLKSSSVGREACDKKCFPVLDTINTAYKLKLIYIMWERPNLNKQ